MSLKGKTTIVTLFLIPENDRVIIALDVTNNAQEVENAYLDPTGMYGA